MKLAIKGQNWYGKMPWWHEASSVISLPEEKLVQSGTNRGNCSVRNISPYRFLLDPHLTCTTPYYLDLVSEGEGLTS